MNKLQIALIIALMIALIALIVIFWGSIASAVFLFCLIIIPCELLIKRHMIDREESDFDDN